MCAAGPRRQTKGRAERFVLTKLRGSAAAWSNALPKALGACRPTCPSARASTTRSGWSASA